MVSSRPGRQRAAFAALTGTSPLEARSGQRIRHRLNRGGDGDLNRALHTVAITRVRCHSETRAYHAAATARGKTHRDIRRSLKCALARRFYRRIQAATRPTAVTDTQASGRSVPVRSSRAPLAPPSTSSGRSFMTSE
ncbi:hypothetical protein GCM10009608_76760 [Pseudonocardia alaniniphila]